MTKALARKALKAMGWIVVCWVIFALIHAEGYMEGVDHGRLLQRAADGDALLRALQALSPKEPV